MKRCMNCFQEYEEQYDVCPHCGYYKGRPPKELYHLFPETVLAGRYIVGEVLGFGGFGITYKAWDMKLETVVAIKEHYQSGLANRIPGQAEVLLYAGSRMKEYNGGLERFLNEARNTVKFKSHKNIVHVFEYFEENNTAYMVMEFLDGVSLSEYLKENSMDMSSCLSIFDSVASALKELHSHGIIHRDVSPDNIFLCLNGSVKLIDFGAARFSTNEESPLTIVLKLGFAPPEQYEKISAQGPWTDIYALGATLYLMLTGVKPDESTDRSKNDTMLAPHEINADIPENISNAIMKAMAVDRHLRFSQVEELEKALHGEKKVVTLGQERKRRKRKKVISILAASLIVAITSTFLGIRFMEQKAAETLPEASISMWYEISGDPVLDDAKINALTAITDEFMNSYPDVTIELVGWDCAEYAEALAAAQENDGKKTLAVFESTSLDADELADITAEITDVFSYGNVDSCYFIDFYDIYFADRNQLPMGFVAPIIYCNKTVASLENQSVSDIDTLLDHIGESAGIAVHRSAADAFVAAFGEDALNSDKVVLVDDSDGFVSGEYGFYVAGSDAYMDIQSKLPARYSIAAFATDSVQAEFADLYSVTQGLAKDEQKVAIAFLNFMLSDNAQDTYYIQNWTGRLPLNSGALHVVGSVYSDFAGFFENIEDYSFDQA